MTSSIVVKQRVMAAIRGAFIADAACMGTHWIYDPSEMARTVTNVDRPEFKNPPSPKYYSSEEFPGHYGRGMLSPYGEQLLFVTEHVATVNKEKSDLSGEIMSKDMLKWAKSFGGRLDGATKTFIDNMQKEDGSGQWPECGADDSQAHIYMKVVPVVARYAGSHELLDKVTQAIKVHQNNQKAIAFGIASARILEAVILGATLAEALDTVEKNLVIDLESSEFKDDVLEAYARGKRGGKEEGKTLDSILKEVSNEAMVGKEDSRAPITN